MHNHVYITELHDQLGDVISIPIDGKPMIFVRHPASVKRVLTSEEEFTKTFADADSKSTKYLQYFKNLVQPLLANANIFGSGDNASRRLGLKKVFLGSKQFLPAFKNVLKENVEQWPLEGRTDTIPLLHNLVFRMVLVIMAGDPTGSEPLFDACLECLAHFQRYSIPMFDEHISPEDEAVMRKVEMAGMAVTKAFRHKAAAGTLTETAANSMLGVMTDFGLDEKEMNATMINALFAACEAPIHVLGAALVQLSSTPELQERLVTELQTHTVEKSPLLNGVVNEALRMFAPVTLVQRATTQDVVLEGYKIPANTNVSVCIAALHSDERFFPDAKVFKPERKLNIVLLSATQGFMPFSGGPRGCPGKYLATTVLKHALAFIVQAYSLSPTTNTCNKKIHKFVEFPTDGAFVGLKVRTALRPRSKL